MKLSLKVKTGASQDNVIKLAENSYRVEIRQIREKGKANLVIIKILSKHFKVPQANINIISGQTAKNKIIEMIWG